MPIRISLFMSMHMHTHQLAPYTHVLILCSTCVNACPYTCLYLCLCTCLSTCIHTCWLLDGKDFDLALPRGFSYRDSGGVLLCACMCIDMHVDKNIDMRIDMCIYMCIDMQPQVWWSVAGPTAWSPNSSLHQFFAVLEKGGAPVQFECCDPAPKRCCQAG